MADKIKVDCVHKCGGSLVKTRHDLFHCRDKGVASIDATIAELEAAIPEMAKHGMKKMQFAKAFRKLQEARLAMVNAPNLIMEAHESLRCCLGPLGIAEPTDDDLKKIIGFGNLR